MGSLKPVSRSRLETNLVRLLQKCEKMAGEMDTSSPSEDTNWRLEKFTLDSEKMLGELKDGPNAPDRNSILEYTRRIQFLQKILHTSKLPTVSEKIAASHLIGSPSGIGGSASGENNDNYVKNTMEIKHRHTNKYAEELRRELLGGPVSKESQQEQMLQTKNSNSKEDMNDLLKYHHSLQEKIADHMLDLTRTLKDQASTAGRLIRKDVDILENSSKSMDKNEMSLKKETERLSMFNQRACKCWVWFMLIVVCSVFIAMALFMRLFKKRMIPLEANAA